MKRREGEFLELEKMGNSNGEFRRLCTMYDAGKRVEAIKGWLELARTTYDDEVLGCTRHIINKCVADIMAKKRVDVGMAVVDELFEYDPSSHHIIMLKAVKCFNSDLFVEALKYFQFLIGVGYDLKYVHNCQIQTYCKFFDRLIASHDHISVGDLIVEAVKKYPNDKEILFRYAGYMSEMENFELALDTMDKVLQCEPNDTQMKHAKAYVYTRYGALLFKQGEIERADECYINAIHLGMLNPNIEALYADYCFLKGNHNRAFEHAKRSIKVDRNNKKATDVMFKIYDKVGFSMWPRLNRAVSSVDPLLDHIKEFKSVIAAYIVAKFKSDEVAQVWDIITDYLKVHTDDAEVKSIFAQVMVKRIRIDIIHSHFTTAQSNIDLLKACDSLNSILYKLRGELHEAKHEYDKMIDSYVSYINLKFFEDVDDVILKLLEKAKQHQELRDDIYSKLASMPRIKLPENATLHMNDADFRVLFSNLNNCTFFTKLEVKCELSLTAFTNLCSRVNSSNLNALDIVVPNFEHTDPLAFLLMAIKSSVSLSELSIVMGNKPKDMNIVEDLKQGVASKQLAKLTLSYLHEGQKTQFEFQSC